MNNVDSNCSCRNCRVCKKQQQLLRSGHLSPEDKEQLYINFWKYKDMSQDEIRDAIVSGLIFLRSTQLVNLHAEISNIQIEHYKPSRRARLKLLNVNSDLYPSD